MEQADLEQVIAIDQKSFTLPWPVSSFQYELAHNDTSRCWVAEVEIEGKRRIAAMAVAWLILDEVHIATIAVEPEYRRMKIGQKLLIAILKDAQASGARHAFWKSGRPTWQPGKCISSWVSRKRVKDLIIIPTPRKMPS